MFHVARPPVVSCRWSPSTSALGDGLADLDSGAHSLPLPGSCRAAGCPNPGLCLGWACCSLEAFVLSELWTQSPCRGLSSRLRFLPWPHSCSRHSPPSACSRVLLAPTSPSLRGTLSPATSLHCCSRVSSWRSSLFLACSEGSTGRDCPFCHQPQPTFTCFPLPLPVCLQGQPRSLKKMFLFYLFIF